MCVCLPCWIPLTVHSTCLSEAFGFCCLLIMFSSAATLICGRIFVISWSVMWHARIGDVIVRLKASFNWTQAGHLRFLASVLVPQSYRMAWKDMDYRTSHMNRFYETFWCFLSTLLYRRHWFSFCVWGWKQIVKVFSLEGLYNGLIIWYSRHWRHWCHKRSSVTRSHTIDVTTNRNKSSDKTTEMHSNMDFSIHRHNISSRSLIVWYQKSCTVQVHMRDLCVYGCICGPQFRSPEAQYVLASSVEAPHVPQTSCGH